MQAIRVMEAPRGPSLVEQARLVATARVQEFQQAGQQQQTPPPATFEMWRVLEAMASNHPVRQVQAVLALQEFMHAPGRLSKRMRGRLHELISGRVQELVTAGDVTTVNNSARDYLDRFLITDVEMDDGWRQLFTVHDEATAAAQANRSGFRVLDITSGIVFKRRLPGEAVEFRKITGEDSFVTYEPFGGGVAIDRIYWDDQDYMTIGDLLTAFRAAAYGRLSDDMYGLLTALSTDYNFSTGADLIAKLNGAAAHIIRALQGKGVQVNARSTFLIVCAVEKLAEVTAALATMSDVAMQTATSKTKLVFNFRVISTVRVPASGTGSGIYVGLPGGRSKAGIRQDLTLYGQFNIARYADDIAGFMRDAGYLEATQWRRIP